MVVARRALECSESSVCLDCAAPYPFALDMTLSDEQWEMIHPAKDGLLCGGCIVRRAGALQGAIAVRAVIEVA